MRSGFKWLPLFQRTPMPGKGTTKHENVRTTRGPGRRGYACVALLDARSVTAFGGLCNASIFIQRMRSVRVQPHGTWGCADLRTRRLNRRQTLYRRCSEKNEMIFSGFSAGYL